MKLPPFELERYFAQYEFSSPYLLSCSDCESLSMEELLSRADDEARNLWETLRLGYTESTGHPILREEIAGLYTEMQAENILTLVPEEGIFIAVHTLLKPGDHIIATFPGYQSLYQIAQSLGCEVSYWKPREETHWQFNADEFEALFKRNTKLVVINFPHNPTGALIEKDVFSSIFEISEKHGSIVFSDEMYRFLEYDEEDRLPSACDISGNAVSLFGMSKSFSLPGLRVGWLAAGNKSLLNDFATFKDYTTICSSAPSEVLALIALREKETIITRNIGILQKNLRLLKDFFRENEAHFQWTPPKAGPIGFAGLKGEIDSAAFCKDLREKMGVMLLPSTVYNYGNRHFRLGFGRKNFQGALEKLSEYLINCSENCP